MKALLALAAALTLTAPALAADHRGGGRDNDRNHRVERDGRDGHRGGDWNRRGNDRDWDRRNNRWRGDSFAARRVWTARDHRPDRFRQNWRVGQRHPYWHGRDFNRYVVVDYRRRHLPPPPRGCAWVERDGDAALVALATGLIVGLAINASQTTPYYGGYGY